MAPPTDTAPPVAVAPSPVDTSVLDADLSRVLLLLSQGFIEQGLNSVQQLDLSLPADPALVAQVALYAADARRLPLAVLLYEKNIDQPQPFGRDALLNMIDLRIMQDDLAAAQSHAAQAVALGYVPSAFGLLSVGDYMLQLAQYDAVSQFLNLFAEHYTDDSLYDRYLWIRARLSEQNADRRDIRAAIQSYEQIVAYYPISQHWEPARARSAYLRRHFVDVR